METRPTMKREGEVVGRGCLLQAAGIMAPLLLGAVLGPVGIIGGIIVMPILYRKGTREAYKYSCSACGTRLANKDIIICPGCRLHLVPFVDKKKKKGGK